MGDEETFCRDGGTLGFDGSRLHDPPIALAMLQLNEQNRIPELDHFALKRTNIATIIIKPFYGFP